MLLHIYISIVQLKFGVDIQSQTKVRVWKPKKSNMATRRPFWKWSRWKSIGFCLYPPSTCIWNLKLKFQSKLDLCSGNHVVYRQTDGRTDRRTDGRTRWIQYTPPPTSLGGGINILTHTPSCSGKTWPDITWYWILQWSDWGRKLKYSIHQPGWAGISLIYLIMHTYYTKAWFVDSYCVYFSLMST